ncbi:hypothetical protein B0T16DRAFT_451015 [Cercophora newfieldiana]|uniref:HNH nuclease domain-containing protein n=1 Tax=Cercophora newfieldiana TaxID=92897 RepID=A0AA39YMK2_9PEZI|nr:hypothetical protein B0T16DRAFT_451015 [Cercophora newfieldiana]
MATQVDEDLRQELESFWQSASPQDREDLTRFLATKPPMNATPSSVIPPTEEAQIRLDLARKLQNSTRELIGVPSWKFSASHLGVIFVMPLDILKQIAHTGRVPHSIPPGADTQLQRASDLIKEFLDARTYDDGKDDRDKPEADKCRERENGACLFTGMADPHACHIMPFSFNSNLQNKRRLGVLISATSLFGNRPWVDLLAVKVRSSDFAWNMLAVSPQLHVWWAQGRWAVKCLGITPVNNQHVLRLEFHWMPQRSQLPRGREIDLDKDEGEQMLKELTTWNGDPNVTLEDHGVIAISDARSHQSLRSGQIFEVRHSTNDDAEKMKDMIDLQWYLILACNLAGAADPPELEDDESDEDFDPNTLEIEPGFRRKMGC